ncbi:MAG: class I SAM-dependent methyltransferase [Cyclobacteriaceae bacterium]
MTIRHFKRFFIALFKILRQPSLLYHVLNNATVFKQQVKDQFPTLANGCPQTTASLLGISLNQSITPYSFLNGTAEIADLALLKGLAAQYASCDYLEIGTWRGESARNMAQCCSRVVSIDLSKEELEKRGYSSDMINAQDHFLDDSIQSIRKPLAKLNPLELGKFDLVFIDGDHHWQAIQSDTQIVFEHLIHDQSIVVWHDYTSNYLNLDWEVLLGVLKGMDEQLIQQLVHVRNTNCLIYWPGVIDVVNEKNPFRPIDTYQIKIELGT